MKQYSDECAAAVTKLNQLCAFVKRVEASKEPEEPAYVQLLAFLHEHSACQPELEDELVKMVLEFRHARVREPRLSIDALAFCMHSLKWSGVLLAMKREHHEYFVPRRDDFPWRLIDAYLPEWEGRSTYAHYRNLHHSGSNT